MATAPVETSHAKTSRSPLKSWGARSVARETNTAELPSPLRASWTTWLFEAVTAEDGAWVTMSTWPELRSNQKPCDVDVGGMWAACPGTRFLPKDPKRILVPSALTPVTPPPAASPERDLLTRDTDWVLARYEKASPPPETPLTRLVASLPNPMTLPSALTTAKAESPSPPATSDDEAWLTRRMAPEATE